MNITNTVEDPLTVPSQYQPQETSSVFSTFLMIFKIVLVMGILFFILYEINQQTNNSIVQFFNQFFKSKSSSSTPTPTTPTNNSMNNWYTYINDKTNSFKKQFYKEPFLNSSSMDLIEPKKYNISQPHPDDSTSNIQNKKGLNQYTHYDTAYHGKIYESFM
jgi:hypothetical protein